MEPFSTEGIEWRERKVYLENKIQQLKSGEVKEEKQQEVEETSDKENEEDEEG